MIKLSEFLGQIDEDIDSLVDNGDVLDEKIIRKKIIRNGKLEKVKRSNKMGFSSRGGHEKKISQADHIKNSKIQKRASKKRASKKAIANIKRKKSMKKRNSMGL